MVLVAFKSGFFGRSRAALVSTALHEWAEVERQQPSIESQLHHCSIQFLPSIRSQKYLFALLLGSIISTRCVDCTTCPHLRNGHCSTRGGECKSRDILYLRLYSCAPRIKCSLVVPRVATTLPSSLHKVRPGISLLRICAD